MKAPVTASAAIDADDIQHAGEIVAPARIRGRPGAAADRLACQPACRRDGVPSAVEDLRDLSCADAAQHILQSLSGTLNNVYLGQMIGVGALAAVSGFFPVMFFFIAFTIGLGAGASVLIGQAWGAREPDKARAVAGTTLMVGILFGLCVALFGGAFTEPMLRLLGTPAGHPGRRHELCANHPDRDAGPLRVSALDGNAAWCRRHGHAALHADDLDLAGSVHHACADPRLVRPAAARRGERRLREPSSRSWSRPCGWASI